VVWVRGGTEQQNDEHQNADHQLERPLVAAIGQDNDRTEYRTPILVSVNFSAGAVSAPCSTIARLGVLSPPQVRIL
jgi:hypothetical protein